jgi:hypothetical protein
MSEERAAVPVFRAERIAWTGLVAGPLAWMIDEWAGYALVPIGCDAGLHWTNHLLSVATIGLVVAGGWIAARDLRRLRSASSEDNAPEGRGHFLSLLGLILSAIFGFAVLLDAIAKVMIDPCLT